MKATQVQKHKFAPVILREYDIRGIVGKNLSEEDAYFIGRAYSTYLKTLDIKGRVCVGYDGRLSSILLNGALVGGLLDSGLEVIHIGLVPTPTLYFSTIINKCVGGIMITGSHNPPEYNGFKIMLQGQPLYGQQIKELALIAHEGRFVSGVGTVSTIDDVREKYVEVLLAKALGVVKRNLKIAWDPGNGSTGEIVQALTSKIPGKHILINEKIDGSFPAHHPDPTEAKNMHQLIELVKEYKCDFGIAFDGDGDRIGVIDDKGRMISGEQLLLIFASDLLLRKKGAKIIADVKTSNIVFNNIQRLGGKTVMWKTGHSNIKSKMKQEKAMLAGEMSGHIFFGENYYNFDDALFGACKLINILANGQKKLSDIVDSFPKLYSTPELRITVKEEEKFYLVDRLKSVLLAKRKKLDDLDGVRVIEKTGWWLLRASNTQNCLVVRVEGVSTDDLFNITKQVIDYCGEAGIPVPKLEHIISEIKRRQ